MKFYKNISHTQLLWVGSYLSHHYLIKIRVAVVHFLAPAFLELLDEALFPAVFLAPLLLDFLALLLGVVLDGVFWAEPATLLAALFDWVLLAAETFLVPDDFLLAILLVLADFFATLLTPDFLAACFAINQMLLRFLFIKKLNFVLLISSAFLYTPLN